MQGSPSAAGLLPRDPQSRTFATGLPPDLLAQSARRLRVQAILYALVFFASDPLTALLVPEARGAFLSSPFWWGPSTVSIAMALAVIAATFNSRLPVTTVLMLGLVFEVVGSFGIAAAQYLDPGRYAGFPPWAGLSWVAVWVIGFAITVPSPPRRVLFASLASASSVPLVVGFVLATNPTLPRLSTLSFFLMVVLPYLLVVVVAYVGARVVYNLGTEITRARELGSYRLVERLGRGGMGEVWRAKHRLLARPAAIKLMRPEMLSNPAQQAELRARFEREAQATASLRSPHTVELYDFGVSDDGTFYYVMELLEGFDCGTLVERFGPIPAERAVYILAQVCHSLAEAHAGGLVHRDIKPANVFVCRQGRDEDFVKVLDFGLVKSWKDDGATEIDLTRAHAVRGTPAFMAPEQILGNRDVDGRTDIYAIGCLAYWLVTGQKVFAGASAMDTLLQHADATPAAPSTRTEMPIPEPFDRLILECLAKNPDERPASADALRARLSDIDAGAQWTSDRVATWWRAHRPAPSA